MNRYIVSAEWKPTKGIALPEAADKIVKEITRNTSVLAGPGSGKTELLAQRANFLLMTGACKSPQKILALSFKVDAAANIQSRVEKRCDHALASRFNSSTFDAFFSSLVRRFFPLLPEWITLPPDFDVIAFDRNWWIEYERGELNGQPCPHNNKPSAYAPLDLSNAPDQDAKRIWGYCSRHKMADYDMCRAMAYTLVKSQPQIKALLLSTYKFLFLDEFQDTTDPQYLFVKEVFGNSDTVITAVGDTNQMIMVWAGANPKNFDNFQTDFGAEIIPLAINHRSNSKIVELINSIIKNLTPTGTTSIAYESTRNDTPANDCIGAKQFDSPQSEATYIAKFIKQLSGQDVSLKPSDFVLILRQKATDYHAAVNQNFLSEGLQLRNEDALVIKDGVKLQDLMAEPLSELVVFLLRKKTSSINYDQEKQLAHMLRLLIGYNPDKERDSKKLREHITALMACIEWDAPVTTWLNQIIESIGVKRLRSVYPQYRSNYLPKVASSISALLKGCLDANPDNIRKALDNYEGTQQVKLMTIHKSKGLEYKVVFFVDFHDQSWWGLKQAVQRGHEDRQREERNSFFVGLSRARDRLYFTKSVSGWPPVVTDLLRESHLLVTLPDVA